MCTEHLTCSSWQPGVGSSGLCPVQPPQPPPLVWYILLIPVSCKGGRGIRNGECLPGAQGWACSWNPERWFSWFSHQHQLLEFCWVWKQMFSNCWLLHGRLIEVCSLHWNDWEQPYTLPLLEQLFTSLLKLFSLYLKLAPSAVPLFSLQSFSRWTGKAFWFCPFLKFLTWIIWIMAPKFGVFNGE